MTRTGLSVKLGFPGAALLGQALFGRYVIMIRFVMRFLGLWILAAGLIFLIYDGTKSIAGNALFLTTVQDLWGSVHQASLLSLKPTLEGISGFLWNPVMTTFLNQPVALVLCIAGAVLLLLGRKKKPLIGYGR